MILSKSQIALLIFLSSVNFITGQNYSFHDTVENEITWKPLIGKFRKLKVETKKYDVFKKEMFSERPISEQTAFPNR